MTSLLLTLLATGYLLALLVVVGRRWSRYSHMWHTTSELGEVGAPDQRLVALGVFLPVGALLLLVAYLLRPLGQPAASLALCIAIGYLAAAAFPCAPGAPLGGSLRQVLHTLGGAVGYVGGAIALMRLSETLGDPFRIAGFIVWGAAVALSFPSIVRGLIQRVAELCLFGGLALAIWLARGAA